MLKMKIMRRLTGGLVDADGEADETTDVVGGAAAHQIKRQHVCSVKPRHSTSPCTITMRQQRHHALSRRVITT